MNFNGSNDSVIAIFAIAMLAFSFGYGVLSPYLRKKGVSESKVLLIVKSTVVILLLGGAYAYRNIS